jgi:hypothetical protein
VLAGRRLREGRVRPQVLVAPAGGAGVLSYLEGARAKAVRRAQRAGRYERLERQRLVLGWRGDRVTIREPDGRQTEPSINAIGPAVTRRSPLAVLRQTQDAVLIRRPALSRPSDAIPEPSCRYQ